MSREASLCTFVFSPVVPSYTERGRGELDLNKGLFSPNASEMRGGKRINRLWQDVITKTGYEVKPNKKNEDVKTVGERQ